MSDPIAPLTPDVALFLDFDGTLAPIGDDPDAVHLPAEGAACLLALAEALGGALAVISGRDIADLSSRTPSGIWRIGGHGLDSAQPGTVMVADRRAHEAPAAMRARLDRLVAGMAGTRLEDKGAVIALHYRAAPDAGPALFHEAEAIIADYDGYRLQHGKMVIEAKPAAANKGVALAAMMKDAPFAGRVPVMVGDDVTDEDAMDVALTTGGFAVKVGDGKTIAPYRLANPGDVWIWLKEMVRS